MRLCVGLCVLAGDPGTNLFAQVTPRPLCSVAVIGILQAGCGAHAADLTCTASPLFVGVAAWPTSSASFLLQTRLRKPARPKAASQTVSLCLPHSSQTLLNGDAAAELIPGVI